METAQKSSCGSWSITEAFVVSPEKPSFSWLQYSEAVEALRDLVLIDSLTCFGLLFNLLQCTLLFNLFFPLLFYCPFQPHF